MIVEHTITVNVVVVLVCHAIFMNPLWETLLTSAFSAAVGAATAVGVAIYQTQRGLAHATQLAIDKISTERRIARENALINAVQHMKVAIHGIVGTFGPMNVAAQLACEKREQEDVEMFVQLLTKQQLERQRASLEYAHHIVWVYFELLGADIVSQFYRLLDLYRRWEQDALNRATDIHQAALTNAQILEFACQTKTEFSLLVDIIYRIRKAGAAKTDPRQISEAEVHDVDVTVDETISERFAGGGYYKPPSL